MQKTLQGVKVLDMTMAISGPIATRILSDFGADVVPAGTDFFGADRKFL